MAELGDVLTLDELTCPRKGEESTMSYVVGVGYDKANHRYYVLSSDIPGLNVEEETFEAFVDVVLDIAPELIGGELIGSKIVFEREVELAAE
ncbi:MAG: hypothetical protein WB663_05945 [Beijerinckiaceae bacterium]|jgi:hypothetical protein